MTRVDVGRCGSLLVDENKCAWAPYMSYDFVSWDKGKTERIQTQFLKQAL